MDFPRDEHWSGEPPQQQGADHDRPAAAAASTDLTRVPERHGGWAEFQPAARSANGQWGLRSNPLDPTSDRRSELRSSVFLAASLQFGPVSLPVRVRNISASGALIEAFNLPAPGTRVRLQRGRLEVSGELGWRDLHLGGLTFEKHIRVEQWVQKAGHAGQQRVDELVAALREEEPIAGMAAPASGEGPTLAAISRSLDELCGELADLPGATSELGDYLIRLDSIAQLLRQLSAR